jgi:UDP-MurNAc hydroxylase
MELQILSHAGLRVAAGGKEILFDPWLVGSCYWRSWWNYPPVPRDLVASLKPDFIYLTHLHWDHFQADSLRLFDDDVQIIVPFDRYDRMVRDLRSIGKKNVRELRHAERAELAPGLAIRSFHLAPSITDSAVVVEAEGQILLNANDSKFAGAPLRQILKHYPNVDFVFRSHSSANVRACFHYIDAPDTEIDEQEHYLRAFSQFMANVRPRFAVPFASNSCLLHADVYDLNPTIQTPVVVRDYFKAFADRNGLDTKLQIMVPGDSWSSETGFAIQEHDWFTNRPAHLESYRKRVEGAMERQRSLESRVSVSLSTVQKYFEELSRKVPWFLMRKLKGREVLIVAQSANGETGFAIDLCRGQVRSASTAEFGSFSIRIEIPALILRQAMAMNMFGHAAISKRVHYYATKADMPALGRFASILNWEEAEFLPLRRNVNLRAMKALLPRWREVLLQLQVVAKLVRGKTVMAIEDELLRVPKHRSPSWTPATQPAGQDAIAG